MNYDLILIRYGELSLKSAYVRKQFESTLVRNIKNAFELNMLHCKITTDRGRIYVHTDEISKGLDVLKRIFGITSFSPVLKTTSDIKDISNVAIDLSQKNLSKEKSFALRVTRTGEHDFTSQDVAVEIGSDIVKATKASVNLTNPDFELFIEIRHDKTFLFTEKIRGTGGLPLGTQGKILALIDDGLESILAAWYIMRRGCDILFVHSNEFNTDALHSFTTHWFIDSDITMIDLKSKNYYESLNKLSSEKKCDAIITGYNFNVNYKYDLLKIKKLKKHVKLPIFLPLIAMDEEEIYKKCKELGI